MNKMSFLPELKIFLKKNGIIYTVRKYKMIEANVEIEDVGVCQRLPIGEIHSKEDLFPYYELSGFSSVENWWTKVEYFIPCETTPKYLYQVTMLNKEE